MQDPPKQDLTESANPQLTVKRKNTFGLKSNWQLAAGVPVFIVVILMAIFASQIATHDPQTTNVQRRFEVPGTTYMEIDEDGREILGRNILGTDELGRDIFSRLVFGARTSMVVALSATMIAAFLGIVIGLITGYFGGKIDALIMRLIDIMLAFPGMLLALFIVAIIGRSMLTVVLAIAIFGVPSFSRIVRGSVLGVKKLEYIDAIRAMGASDSRIMFGHIFPNILSPIIVQAALNIGIAIVVTAALSFLGVGIQPPTPEWGTMLYNGRQDMWRAPHLVMIPGIMIFIVVLAINLIGDGLRYALEPKKTH